LDFLEQPSTIDALATKATPASPLTLKLVIPKMALDSELHSEAAILANFTDPAPRNLFRAIATDIHFWIPLSVLLGGVFLLDKLR
jgi:hypothetical protein